MNVPHVPKRWSRLTKRDALLLCEEEWTWQGENPYDMRNVAHSADAKSDWPRFKANGGDVPDWSEHHDCPCCRYAGFRYGGAFDCPRCPIPAEAWSSEARLNAPCEDSDSPYKKWLHVRTKKGRSKYAFAIAALARAELDKEA
jgi:hypothetical protein